MDACELVPKERMTFKERIDILWSAKISGNEEEIRKAYILLGEIGIRPEIANIALKEWHPDDPMKCIDIFEVQSAEFKDGLCAREILTNAADRATNELTTELIFGNNGGNQNTLNASISILDYILESKKTYTDCSTKQPTHVNLAKRAWINLLDSDDEEQARAMSAISINGVEYTAAYGVPVYVEGRAILWPEYLAAKEARKNAR